MKRLLYYLCVCFLLFPAFCLGDEKGSPETLIVHFLDVGQGDAAILQCGGQTLMIDGGPREANQFVYSYLTETLHLDYLDYVISTHPHDDHTQGLATALVVCDAGIIYSPVTEYEGNGFGDLKKKVEEHGKSFTVPHRGDSFALGSATVTFLSETDGHEEWNTNDHSLVVRVTFGDTAFIFTGDAEGNEEQDILESGMELHASILKIGHHGSLSSTSQNFLDAVSPEYAIISVGENNDYGHPAEETLLKLNHARISVFRTDIHGTIVCTSDGTNIAFKMTKKKNKKW